MDGIHIGTSGWSYPTWRPAFYPAGMDPKEFLSFYAQRFDTVELNTTGYRLPAEEQFQRWAAQTPDGFTFAVKMPLTRLDRVGTFVERVEALGDRLGPVRIVVEAPRDEGLLAFLHGSLPKELSPETQRQVFKELLRAKGAPLGVPPEAVMEDARRKIDVLSASVKGIPEKLADFTSSM
jgi:hypothetical protein